MILLASAQVLGGLEIAYTGYRDTARLASSNPPMRADILLANKDAVRVALIQLRKERDQIDQLLDKGDRDAILGALQQACDARDD